MYPCIRHACITITDPHNHTRQWCIGFSEGVSGDYIAMHTWWLLQTTAVSLLCHGSLYCICLLAESYETMNIGLDLAPFSEKVENLWVEQTSFCHTFVSQYFMIWWKQSDFPNSISKVSLSILVIIKRWGWLL